MHNLWHCFCDFEVATTFICQRLCISELTGVVHAKSHMQQAVQEMELDGMYIILFSKQGTIT